LNYACDSVLEAATRTFLFMEANLAANDSDGMIAPVGWLGRTTKAISTRFWIPNAVDTFRFGLSLPDP